MGKHPGEQIFSFSTSEGQNIFLKDLLDQRLPSPVAQDAKEVVSTATLALACVCANPQGRPTMQYVANELSANRPTFPEPFDTITVHQLFKSSEMVE